MSGLQGTSPRSSAPGRAGCRAAPRPPLLSCRRAGGAGSALTGGRPRSCPARLHLHPEPCQEPRRAGGSPVPALRGTSPVPSDTVPRVG